MIKEKIEGNIIHIASTSGKVARPSMAAYGSSKAAVIRVSQILALELASSQINVNSISPAGIDSERTGLLAAAYSSEEIPHVKSFLRGELCKLPSENTSFDQKSGVPGGVHFSTKK